MVEQVCMAWGAVKVRRGPRAKPPKPPPRKCACGCGTNITATNKRGYTKKCWYGSPEGRESSWTWYQKVKSDPVRWAQYCANKQAQRLARRLSNSMYAIQHLMRHARERAVKYGVPFSITPADLEPFPTHCCVLGIELQYQNIGHHAGNSASIDRIVPALGYVPGNARIISFRANTLKSNATPEELAAVAGDAARLRERRGLKAVNA